MSITATKPRRASPGCSRTYFGKNGAQMAAAIFADDKTDGAKGQGLLQDHRRDGAILRADQFQHSYFANLAEGQGVDDKSDDGGADNGQDNEEHADLFGRGGDQFEMRIFCICARV